MKRYISLTYSIDSDEDITEEDIASVMEYLAEQDYEGHPAGIIQLEEVQEVEWNA